MRQTIESALNSLKENSSDAEIAFFGGSFTAIDRAYMRSLLDATVPYIDRFLGIRVSTRPDAIDDEALSLLRYYHVTSVELGAQSMDDTVLSLNDRGHTADDVRRSSSLIRSYGMELGLQMMTGLYGSTALSDIETAQKLIALSPDTVRIYPTIVMRYTRLCEMYERGLYSPPPLDSAVQLCAHLMTMFSNAHIRVIRVGLHDTAELRRDMVAGPYHPAFRELCESRMMLVTLLSLLNGRERGSYTVAVHPRDVSKLIGHKRQNLRILHDNGYDVRVIQDAAVPITTPVLR